MLFATDFILSPAQMERRRLVRKLAGVGLLALLLAPFVPIEAEAPPLDAQRRAAETSGPGDGP